MTVLAMGLGDRHSDRHGGHAVDCSDLRCPSARCGAKLGGAVRWDGLRCACGSFVGPAVYVSAARLTVRPGRP
jgi:hypothetical protein